MAVVTCLLSLFTFQARKAGHSSLLQMLNCKLISLGNDRFMFHVLCQILHAVLVLVSMTLLYGCEDVYVYISIFSQ